MEEQIYNSIHSGQQIDQAVTWLLAHAHDQIFGGGISAGTIQPPSNPTYWIASPGEYTCGTNVYNIPANGVGIISYDDGLWSCMAVGGVDIINNLTSGGTQKALSAEQGKVLKEITDNIKTTLNSKIDFYDASYVATEGIATVAQFEELVDAVNQGKIITMGGYFSVLSTSVGLNNSIVNLSCFDGRVIATYKLTLDNNNVTITGTTKRNQIQLENGESIKTINNVGLLGSGNIELQPTLVSGTNIKTINSQTLLGSGNVDVQAPLVSGTNIKTINNQSLLGGGNITIQGGSGGGGIGFVEFETHADMEEDSHQPEGTIGYVTDEGTFYTCYRGDWSQLTNQGCDISWVFAIVGDVDVSVYTKLRYLASVGMPMSADGCPVMVEVGSNNVLFCKMGSDVWSFVSITSNGRVGGYTEPAPAPLLKTTISGATPTQALTPNRFYQFGSVTSLTVTLTAGHSQSANIYAFRFTAGQDNPTITLPQGVVCNQDLSLSAGDVCEFSIMDNQALFSVWEAQS